LQSRWAYWLELPVSLPALVVYLAFLGTTVLLQKKPAPDDERGSWAALIVLSVIVAGAALWFIGLQVFVIGAFCKFCLTAHACGLAAALLCIKNIPLTSHPDVRMWAGGSTQRGIPRPAILSLVILGLAGVVVLAAGQLLVQKQRNVVKVIITRAGGDSSKGAAPASFGKANSSPAAKPPPPSPSAHLAGPRLLSLYSNTFSLRLDELPVLGSPASTNVIVYVFDYTCHYCRSLHPILVEAQRQLSNQLAIVCLPMPISTNCNPFMPTNTISHSGACDYAKLGLAVWHSAPAAFPAFDNWMFRNAQPAPLEQAQAYAEKLVGRDKLAAALTTSWVQDQLMLDCRLHATNWAASGNPLMPQLVMGDAISSGPLNSVQQFFVLLNRYLGMDMSAQFKQ
jgi:hypothetical protein